VRLFLTQDSRKRSTKNVKLFWPRSLAANKGTEKIAIEVKSFLAESPTYAFHQAVGQYRNYLFALEEKEAERVLYLAVPLFILSASYDPSIRPAQ